MKIIIIGSAPRSLLNFRGPLLKQLVQEGHQVIALAHQATESIRSGIRELGVEYQDIPLERSSLNPFQDLVLLRRLVQLFRYHRPDAVLCYTIKPVIWGGLAARLAGVPHYHAMITGLGYAFLEGGGWKQRLVKRVASGLYRKALAKAETVFFQNPDDEYEFHKRKLLKPTHDTIQINGSGVDLDYFKASPLPEPPVFLLLARLIGDKGIREYSNAARQLKAEYPEARFLLGGRFDSNPSAAITQEEVTEWEQTGHIEYLGNLDDVRPAIASCSVYVLPSYYREGVPRSILEAMAMERPIITTDAPGCRETVEEGVNGFLVPPRSVDSLITAMRRFIEEPDLSKMGEASLEQARCKYDVHAVNEAIISRIRAG